MPDPVHKIPTSSLTVDATNDWAARFLAHHNQTMPAEVEVRDRYFPIYDIADATTTVTVVRRSSDYNGPINVATIPWNDDWEPGVTGDGQMILRDYDDGRQWGVWAPVTPSFFFGPTRYLLVGAAYLIKSPSGVTADIETYTGNFKGGTGSGYPPHPVTADELDAELIEHWVPISYANAICGASGYAWSPAGGFEQINNPEPYAGFNDTDAIPEGVRLGLDPAVVDETWLEAWLDGRGLTGTARSRAKTIAVAMRDYGIFLQLTGPKSFVLLADVDASIDQHLIDGLITSDTLISYEAPVSTLPGGATTSFHGWAESIAYPAPEDPPPDEGTPDPPAESDLTCLLEFVSEVIDGEAWSATGQLIITDLNAAGVTIQLEFLSTNLGASVSITGELGDLSTIDETPQSLGDLDVGSYDFIVSGDSHASGAAGETVRLALRFTASNAPDEASYAPDTLLAESESIMVLATLTDSLEILAVETPTDGGCGTYDHGIYEAEGATYDALDPSCNPTDGGGGDHGDGCGCEACECEHQGTLEVDLVSPAAYARNTLGGGRQELRERLGELTAIAWSDGELNRWLNEGVREVARQTMHLEDIVEFCAVSETSEYQPDQLAAAFSIDHIDYQPACESIRYPLEYRDLRSMDAVWYTAQNQTLGIPEFFSIWGIAPNMKLRFYPTPSEAGTFRVYYWRVPELMATDDDQMEVPSGWEDLVVDFAEYKALRRDRDPRWQEAKAAFDERISYMLRYTSRHTPNTGTFDQSLTYANVDYLYGMGIL